MMITTHISYKKLRKAFLGIALLLGLFATSFKLYAADIIPFQDTIQTIFSSWLNVGYYSNTNFHFGGNNFVGIVFWQTGEQLSVPENISINSGNLGAQSISCSTHLRGIYYNNQRGRRIWPLDTGNLAILSGLGLVGGYTDMTMSGGFYTNCTGVSGGYTPQTNDIYGQVDHTIDGQTGQSFRMIAGVQYNFTGNAISGAAFDHTLQLMTGQIHSGFIFDTNGGIAELAMNMPWCQSFESSPSTQPIIISHGNDMTFTCQGTNANGFILRVFLSGGTSPIYQDQQSTQLGSYIRLTGANLATGDYVATCTVLGPNNTGPQCGNNIPFHVGGTVIPPTGCNPNFQGEITFAPSFGSTVLNSSLGTYYTNRTGVLVQLGATEPTHFVLSGDFLETPRSGNYVGTGIFNYAVAPITLANSNTWNYFSNTYSTGTCTYTDAAKRIYVDTLAPTTPSIISPANAAGICPSTPLSVTRTASTDSGAGLANYRYEIYANSGMVTGLLLSGTTTTTGTAINISLLPLGTYYLRILATDAVGNTSTSSTTSFTTSSQYCGGGTGIMIATPTIWLRNVDLNKVYRSDPIIVFGLTGPAMVSISKGMLFINNTTGGNGTTGMVTSADTFYIEMISTNTYDTTVTSTISILGQTGAFSLTTKKNSCTLSASEKLVIDNIYAELKDEYNNDISKYEEFLSTFQNMVEDESELSNSCTLDYLLTLMGNDDDGGVDTRNHITPNCKEYSIGYDTTQKAYYAPEMMNRYFFINRESLIRHLDYYNPGDCHINTYGNNFWTAELSTSMKHIAPNGKIYHLVGQYGGFSATEFASAKYFDSLDSIYRYIDGRNPAKEIWKHTIDASFTPIVYAAPNGKEYKIYKTDRGYMSYKLMKVKYYLTLSELKTHVNKNNPSKR